ncbi:MAG: Uncharacterised protein [Halieaceae bacterium]|nr:MAG: Uncharacterised protein [Halieaceae bacterium]
MPRKQLGAVAHPCEIKSAIPLFHQIDIANQLADLRVGQANANLLGSVVK